MSWLAANLLAASVLILVVLLIRGPVARLFGARAAYALWLAPALRLVWPSLPDAAPVTAAASTATVYWALVAEPAREQLAPVATILLAIWAVGALVMLVLHLAAHHRFLRKALDVGQPLLVEGVPNDIVATKAVDGPMATGLVNPLILVPHDFEARFTPEQRRLALLHEQLHHKRGDIWASAVALVAASTLWFNPFAWLALGAFRRDMESACDASLLGTAGHAAAPAYAETILRCAARPVPRSLCALTSIDELKGRLKMLNAKPGIAARLGGLMLAGGLVIGGLVAVPAAAVEPKTQTKEIRTVIVEHDGNGPHEVTLNGDPSSKMDVDCPGSLTVVDVDTAAAAGKKEQAKIVICSKTGSNEDIAKGLERALANVDKNEDMNVDVRTQFKSKLHAKIAELRAVK